jgi:hypothetical protein
MAKNFFLAQAMAYITGDTDTSRALKIQKQAISGLRTQISNMEAETINKEEVVDDAKEAFNKAFVNNGVLMSTAKERTDYVTKLIESKEAIADAEEALKSHVATISFLKEQLAIAEELGTEEFVATNSDNA